MAKKRKADRAQPLVVDITPLSTQAQLRAIRLLKSMCELGVRPQAVPELQQKITLNSAPKADDPKVLTIRAAFTLAGNNPDGQEGLRVEATFGILYGIDSLQGISDDQMRGFSQIIALSNVWPYWREFVQSTFVRMGLPPLSLPLVQPAQLHFTPIQTEGILAVVKKKGGKKTKQA